MHLSRFSRCVLAVGFAILLSSPRISAQSNVVDASTLTGKLMMGYQGWHAAQGDGSAPNKYIHWGHADNAKPSPTDMVDDIWPDLSEFTADELFATDVTLGNGQAAKVYSAYKLATVNRHFQWMRDYGIDGVFIQRFIKDVALDPAVAQLRNTNLTNVRAGAETYGRVFAVEYDMSNDDPSNVVSHLQTDWAFLTQTLGVTNSSRYLKHNGKPVVGVYGLGFVGNGTTTNSALAIINNFKNSGCVVMGGVPFWWRTLNNDSQSEIAWSNVYRSFDIISPWAVGRYTTTNEADSFKSFIASDLADATAHGLDYLPVILPGYSAANLAGGTKNGIPRVGGRFYWRQAYNTISVGCSMLFCAMFDEVDEGTAIYKLAPTMATSPTNTPASTNVFALDVDGESLPNDWYLRVAGQINRAVHGDLPLNETIPISPTNQITVTSPNGGNTWTQGTQVTVTWSTTGTVNVVNIDLSTDDGDTWSRLISNVSNTGSKTLRVPHVGASTNCRVRISEGDGTPTDWSDTTFTIQATTSNLGTHLEPLWSIAPGSRSYVTTTTASAPNQRSIAYNALSNQVYIISRTGATSGLTVNVVNAITGADMYSLNTSGISGGNIILLMMCVADDGALYAGNMSSSSGSVASFKLYRWANSGSATTPTLVFTGEPANRADSVRWGDAMHVRGTGTNTQIIIDAQATNLCAILTPTNSSLNNWTSTGGTQQYFGGSIGRSLQFGNGDTFWQKRKNDRLQQSSFTTSPLTTTVVTNYNLLSSTAGGVGMDFTQNFLATVNFAATTNQPDTLDFYDTTNIYNAALLGSYDFLTNQQGNPNFIAHVICGGDKIFAIDGNNGVLALQIVSPPTITNQPQSQTVSNGTTASFNVAAGGVLLNYQWRKNGSAISSATNSSLALTNVQSSDSASYSVIVSNSAGSMTSSNAVLTVLTPISVTSQPANTTNNAATSATLSVSITGSNPQFQWRKNGASISNGGNISGATTASLTVANLLKADAGSYSAVITNVLNSVTSATAYLEVIDPVITSQPQNQAVATGASATFSVTAAGTTPFTYRWKKSGADLANGGNISGATTASLTVANVQSSDATNYSVAVSNSVGYAISSAATLSILQPPTITNQPASRTNNAGTTATFTIGASGLNLSYQWFRNSTNGLADGGNISGATSATLTLTIVTSPDAASYNVIVSNAVGGVTSSVATLTVLFPMPYHEPFDYPAESSLGGQTNGDFLSWFDVGTATAGPYITNVAGNLQITGLPAATGNSVKFGGLGKSERFSFATGTAVTSGTLFYSFALRVLDTNGLNTSGVFIAGFNNSIGSQSSQPSAVGTRVYIRSATGGYNLGVAKNSSTSTDWVWDSTVFTTNDTVFIAGSYAFNSGSSTDDVSTLWLNPGISAFGSNNPPAASLVATNGADITANQILSFVFFQRSANEPTAMLADELRIGTDWSSVTPNPPPIITSQPSSRTNNSGTTATFSVSVTGTNVTYQWQHNGVNLSNGGNVSGATTTNLTLNNIAAGDAGIYLVIVSTPGGSVTSAPAVLTITGDPLVTSQPVSRTVSPGANVGFFVAASGTMPFTYQWRFNGTNLAGQISTALSLTNVNFPQAGKYSAVVSNPVSSAASDDAILSVTAFQPGSGVVLGGGIGSHYQIDHSTNLSTSNWTVLSNFFLPSSPFTVPDTSNSNSTQRFYRVMLLP